MIDIIRSRPGITVPELASITERSERTVYRWLSELSTELNTPTCFMDGGYCLTEVSDPKAVDLSPEEVLAIRMGLKSSPFGEGSPLQTHADSAWLKIRNAVSWQKLSASKDMAQNHLMDVKMPKSNVDPEIVETIEASVNGRKRLRVLYRSQKSNEVKTYVVDPYAVVFKRHSWYLLAFSFDHQKVIQMKLARFQGAFDTGLTFEPPVNFSVENYFRLSWEAWAGGEPTTVQVRFSPRVAAMIMESKRHPTQVVHSQSDGSVIFEAEVAGIEEIAIWILGYGKEAEALEPESLRDYIIEQIKGAAANYQEAEMQAQGLACATT